MAQSDKTKTLTSICSESIPHLKRGAIRDFKNIMQGHHYWRDSLWNQTDSIYTFETGSIIEFFSTDNGDKLRGARRDRLFINEANNVTFEAFEQLEIRTKDFVILDWNPSNELEQRKNRKGWWKVYGLGQLGEVEGKIYKDWAIIDDIPHEARLERYGMDFGYTNDPTAIVAIYYYNGGYILDEITYQKGLSNKQIADILLSHPTALVVADSAEPKSIDEIAGYGVSIVGAEKGKDSVRNGIALVQAQRISMTKKSVNIIREFRNYLWTTDRDGKIINEPEGGFDHTADALRYGLSNLIKNSTGDMESEKAERLMSRLKGQVNQTR